MEVKQNKSFILFPELKEGVVVIVPQTKHILSWPAFPPSTDKKTNSDSKNYYIYCFYHQTNFCEMFSLKTAPKQYISIDLIGDLLVWYFM